MANRKTLAIIPGRFDVEELEDLKQVIETYTYEEISEQMELRGHHRRTRKAYLRTANRNGLKINWGENGRPLRRFTPDEVAAIELLAPTTPIPQMPAAMEAAGFEPRNVSSYYSLASKLGIKIKTNRHTTTNKDIEIIKSLRWEGRTERQIAAVIGMNRTTVHTIINKHKFRIKPGIAIRKIRLRRFTPDEVTAIELLAPTTPISQMPAAMEAAGFEPRNVSSYYRLTSKLGIKIKTKRHTTTNKDIELIKSLRWEGRTEGQIAAVIGMTRGTVNAIINKHKFRIKPGIAIRKIRQVRH